MSRQHLFGGVIVGATSALVANVLLFGSLFTDGRTEATMFVLAGLALVLSVGAVLVTALVRPSSRGLIGPSADRFTHVA